LHSALEPNGFRDRRRAYVLWSGKFLRQSFLLLLGTFAFVAEATTIGGAMGNASTDARPIVWKNRDGGEATGTNRHFISYVTERTYPYLGIHPSDEDPRMGLNEVGVAFGNSLAYPADDSETFTESPNYRYANNQAFKQYILGETASLDQARQAIIDNVSGSANDWPRSIGLMAGIFDANGKVVLWEIGDNEYYEYDPENPNRLAQLPWQIYARDNTVHTRIDHTDDWNHTANRYVLPRNLLLSGGAAGGNTITDFIRVARAGEPGRATDVPSRESTSSTMIAHGVLSGEDPRVATMWTALGQPDYACFVPVWVAIGNDLSSRVSTNALHTSLGGASEKLWEKRAPDDYDQYLNSLIEPMEANFIEIVEIARIHWLQAGFNEEEARRIHQEASETAWRTMNVMAGGSGRKLNVTPELTALSASVKGLRVSFAATASDPDGRIASHEWNFGDGTTSTSASPAHRYSRPGTYLIRNRVTDNSGARNSKWIYVTLGPADKAPIVTITAVDTDASEPGSDTAAFAVTRSRRTFRAIEVNIALSGTAIEGDDYQTVGSTVTIPAGSAVAMVTVTPLNDVKNEYTETVIAALTPGVEYIVGTTANATISIADDETFMAFEKGDTWRYFKGTSFPGPAWNTSGFDDSTWLAGPTGIGYGDGDDQTVLTDMSGNYITAYMRKEFTIDDPSAVTGLGFRVDYDDGFVAFINGTEVARRGVAAGQNENTTAADHEAGLPEPINLSEFVNALQTGSNVFAIEVHNGTLTSSDLSMIPELRVLSGVGTCDDGPLDSPSDFGCDSLADSSEIDGVVTLDIPLGTGADDAEEKADGSITVTSLDLEMFDYDVGGPHRAVGLHFDGVNILPRADVSNAYIQFEAAQTDSIVTVMTVEGQDVDDAPGFTVSLHDITLRPTTTASVTWSPAPWTDGDAGPDQRTENIAPIIKEIVNRPGWAQGNSLALILSGTGERVATSYDASPNSAPILHVEFMLESAGNMVPGVNIRAPADITSVVEGIAR